MKEFIFEGTLNGKIIKDYIDANDKNQAEKLLKRRKIKIQKLKANPKPLLASKKVKTSTSDCLSTIHIKNFPEHAYHQKSIIKYCLTGV